MTTIKLEEIKYENNIYPREKWNNHTVEEYIDALRGGAKFPPLILEKDTNVLLDGIHRWKAYQEYIKSYTEYKNQPQIFSSQDGWATPVTEIEVEYHVVPGGIPKKLYAAGLSARHGDRISIAEKKALAREIFEANPDFKLEKLVEYLGGSKSSASDYVSDIRARRREAQKMIAYRLHRLGWTQEEIANSIGCSDSNLQDTFLPTFPELEISVKKLIQEGIPHTEVAERYNMPLILVWAIALSGLTDLKRFEQLKINCQPYDVWNFHKCHDLFGFKYPGRIPGELVAHVLYFFTQPGDTVIDPMVGSGTTLDVCLVFGRKCYAYDIQNRFNRPDLIHNDLKEDGWAERIKKANLIFWDPPYFSKMDSQNIGEEGYGENSISKLSKEAYLEFFSTSLKQAKKQVKKGTKLAFLMSDWDDATKPGDGVFLWNYANIIQNAGWKVLRHIQVPLSTQQVHPDIVNKFREQRRLARLERYLLVADS